MRILCLHGSGASGDIMKTQLATLRSLLPSTYTYDYLSSPLPCSAAPELQDVYPGPYSCFFTQYSPSEMEDAVGYVREVVEEDGPYDAVIGFSQGAAVAAAYITALDHESLSESEHDALSFRVAIFICAALIPPQIATTANLEHTIGSFGPISIPTVHIIGRKDTCLPQSMELAKSCDKTATQILLNNEGHEVPREKVAVKGMAVAVERAFRMAFSG